MSGDVLPDRELRLLKELVGKSKLLKDGDKTASALVSAGWAERSGRPTANSPYSFVRATEEGEWLASTLPTPENEVPTKRRR